MAWKPNDILREGELDNTRPGKVTGWLRFVGMKETVRLELDGDFSTDVRGMKLRVHNPDPAEEIRPSGRMDGFAWHQTGKVVHITAGRRGGPACIEWCSDQNGLVLLKLAPQFVEIEGWAAPSREHER